jgi:hypothetical protein
LRPGKEPILGGGRVPPLETRERTYPNKGDESKDSTWQKRIGLTSSSSGGRVPPLEARERTYPNKGNESLTRTRHSSQKSHIR